ncbi:Phosphatidylinositol-4-phosphate 5-kinase [Mortierella sp. AD011]|nr:Phosphatidylinositol-4-phosphate 5-kinase [Mortierella sp. AD011]
MTPPRISSLSPTQPTFPPFHQPHSPPPSPPRVSSPNGYFYDLKQSNPNGAVKTNGYLSHNHNQQSFELEPSPTLSATETFPVSLTATSSSTPASSISTSLSSQQPNHIDLALAALSASPPRASTSTISSNPSTSTTRPRPSSYAPTKVTDVSSTLVNLSTLATFPIPPASSVPTSTSSSPVVNLAPTFVPNPESKTTAQELPQEQPQSIEPVSKESDPQPLSISSQPPNMSISPTTPTTTTTPTTPTTPTAAGAAGAGGGYNKARSSHPGHFAPPTRASTMDYRSVRSKSALLGESPASSKQLDSQAESSGRSKRKQIYRRNTYSADLASNSFHRSDDELEMDELEEARRRMDALKKSSSRRMSKRKKDDDDRVLIGTRIGEDHVNYVLMYNMLTGIRVSVSRCQAKLQRPLVDEDFTSAHKLAFDITGNELTPSSKYDFKFKDYAPWVFRNLREDFHIDASDYLVSLTSKYILSELGSPGKSGSFFYFSQDYRFIIKTIHHTEHKFMRKILKDYFNHVKQNPHTLLCRFFGLHRVKLPHGRKIHFVVMGNVFPPNRDIHETYDLKGSTLGRAISDEELASNPRATQKDLNWVNRNRKLELGPEKRHLFVEQLKRDVELLARLNIMDYSLLIGIHDIERGNKDNIRDNTLKVFQPDTKKQLAREPSRRDKRESKVNALRMAVKESDPVAIGPSALPSYSFSERRRCVFYADDGGLLSTNEQNVQGADLYYLGIIDILTPYNYVKKVEHYWKSMSQDKHAISAVHPKEYGKRFLSFMIHALKVNNDVLEVLDKKSHPHSE